MKHLYKGTDCRKEYYEILDKKCFRIREDNGIRIAKFFVDDEGIVMVTNFAAPFNAGSCIYKQQYGKNIYFENDNVMDVVKSIYLDDNGNIIESNFSYTTLLTEEQYEKLHSFIKLYEYKLKDLKRNFRDQLFDLKEHLNIY